MHKILFSSVAEAISKARKEFQANPELEWILATGAATVAGIFNEGTKGDLVLHRSGRGAWTQGRSIEDTKATIAKDD